VLPATARPAERAATEIPAAALHAEAWSYVALGHYHVCREVAPRAYYSGSIDYTSSNPWGELREERDAGLPGKGFLEHDLATGAHRFHHVPPARPLLDLEPIDAAGMVAADVDRAIRARVDTVPGGIEERVVRVTVRNLPRAVARELDPAALREYRRRALHFQVDARRPDPVVRRRDGDAAPGRRATLTDLVHAALAGRTLPPGLERDAFVALGMRYLEQAGEAAASLPPAPEG
jgi:DNA repair exonuclease SbcCD nuclease subunit